MPRYAAKIFYDGLNFHGFQFQVQHRTVAGEILKALQASKLIECVERARFQAASRTDAGASALGQTIAFTSPASFTPMRLNAFLPEDIHCWSYTSVDEDFNPRSQALRRLYLYVAPYQGNLTLMKNAAKLFTDTHDFRKFTRTPRIRCVKTLDSLTVKRYQNFILCEFSSRSFARGMIRSIVSALVKVGEGKLSKQTLLQLLKAEEEINFPLPPAPAENLILLDVKYRLRFIIDAEARSRLLNKLMSRAVRFKIFESCCSML